MNSITIFSQQSENYINIITSIQNCYKGYFQADILPSPDLLYCLRSTAEAPEGDACLGVTYLANQSVLCESYLESPIENLLNVARTEIIELSSLASFGDIGAGIEVMGKSFYSAKVQGYGYAIMTGTRQIRKMMTRLKIKFDVVADAHENQISPKHGSWGSYYQFDPKVCVVNLTQCELPIINTQLLMSKQKTSLNNRQ